MSATIPDSVISGIVLAGKCIPMNDSLAAPLGSPLAEFIGAFWGMTPYVVAGMLVILAFAGIFNAMTDRAARFMKGMMWVAGTVIGVWFIAMLIFVLMGHQPDVPGCPF